MTTKINPDDKQLLDLIVEDFGSNHNKCKDGSCAVCTAVKLLKSTYLLSKENEVINTMFIVKHGLIPFAAQFFLMGIEYAEAKQGIGELEKIFSKELPN